MPGQISFATQGGGRLATTTRTGSLTDRVTNSFLADDLFQLLEPAYLAASDSWIEPAAKTWAANRSRAEADLPKHLQRLLPFMDGWTYLPRWYKPEHLDVIAGIAARGNLVRRSLLSNFAEQDDEVVLLLLETTILRRAEQHAIFERTEQLLDRALSEAKDQLECVLRMEQNGITWCGEMLLEQDAEKKQLREQEDTRFQNQIRLMTLRVHWLETWLEAKRAEKVKRRKQRTTRVTKDNLPGLIKPEELRTVLDFFQSLEDERPAALLSGHDALLSVGLWYVFMLQRCGVTWRELRRIRKAHKGIVRKHFSTESRRQRVGKRWGDIVFHKVLAKEGYQPRLRSQRAEP